MVNRRADLKLIRSLYDMDINLYTVSSSAVQKIQPMSKELQSYAGQAFKSFMLNSQLDTSFIEIRETIESGKKCIEVNYASDVIGDIPMVASACCIPLSALLPKDGKFISFRSSLLYKIIGELNKLGYSPNRIFIYRVRKGGFGVALS